MRVAVIILATASLGVPLAQAAGPNTLLLAKSGKLECYQPDTARKTCLGLGGFTFHKDGSITSSGDILINKDPPLIMHVPPSAVTYRNGAFCGLDRKDDIENATFLLSGKPVNAASDRRIKDDMLAQNANRFGKTICTSYSATGTDRFVMHESIDGVPQPKSDAAMIWVEPDGGYSVAP
jgi:hypothetical protein